MPTYEYLCRQCGHRFEAWQKMTDDPLTVCPNCGGEIHRVLYPASIVFKGSGFYKTEYGANGGANKETAQSKAESGESKTSTPETSKPSAESSKSEGSSPSSPTTTAAD